MSTPSPQEIVELPTGKSFNVAIESPNYPDDGELVFSRNSTAPHWTAAYSVPSVMLTELNCPVTQAGRKVEFGFTLNNVTHEQKKAGYLEGPYVFSFDPLHSGTEQFVGKVKDPRPDQAEDNFTARGNEVDPKSNISSSY